MIKIKKVNPSAKITIPRKGDAGIDLHTANDHPHALYPGDVNIFGTGIALSIPEGWVGLITPRSGLGTRGLILANGTGVIDSSYRGEVMLPLWNRNDVGRAIEIDPYMKVAQLIVVPHYGPEYIEFVDELDDTDRGDNGFGSTGH